MKIKSPSQQLRNYVKYYWALDYKHNIGEEQGIIPTGLADIYFHFENLPVTDSAENNSQLFISKPTVKPHSIFLDGHISFIAVALYPHTPMLLFDFPADYYTSSSIPLNICTDKSWSILHNRLYDSLDFDAGVTLIEDYLTRKIYSKIDDINSKRIAHAVELLTKQSGNISPAKLSSEVCLSQRQFTELFKKYTGVTAGNMSKILRMQKAIHLMQQGITDLADIYYMCNYYDHSHFIKDSKSLTGITPKNLIKDANLCSDYYATL